MDALRSFLSGRRLAIMGIFLAIPFVFFGSSSFGTVFNNYGKVNGLNVSKLDVNIAINSVTSRLQQIYGDCRPSILRLQAQDIDYCWGADRMQQEISH